MCFLSPLQLHIPLVAPARPSQFVHNNPFEARKRHSAAACALSNLQVTSHTRLLLRDVLSFHLSHPSHSCGLPHLLPYVPGRTAARRGPIPAAKSLTNVSGLACASLWYSLPLEHVLPQKYSQLVLQPLPWAFVDRSYRSLSLDPPSWTSVPPPRHLISSLRRGYPSILLTGAVPRRLSGKRGAGKGGWTAPADRPASDLESLPQAKATCILDATSGSLVLPPCCPVLDVTGRVV